MNEPDPAAIRRARRTRQLTVRTSGTSAPPEEVEFADTPPRHGPGGPGPGAQSLLGVRPGVSALAVVASFQRLMRATTDEHARRDIVAAFRQAGPPTIRSSCPYGHPLGLYDIDGDAHSAYCAACYETDDIPFHAYRYVAGATCLNATHQPVQQDVSRLPYGAEPAPSHAWTVSYSSGADEQSRRAHTMRFICEDNGLALHPDERFTVLYRDRQPWRLLNHTIAQSFELDPYRSHRASIEQAAARRKLRAARARGEDPARDTGARAR